MLPVDDVHTMDTSCHAALLHSVPSMHLLHTLRHCFDAYLLTPY